MQTPAEKYLISTIINLIQTTPIHHAKLLNMGAAKSVVLENKIKEGLKEKFICDRMDIADCQVEHETTGHCFTASVEAMPEIKSAEYDIAFANYVFEHVENLNQATAEVARVIKPGGYFITSLPNPIAPEFILSRYTPTKFHQLIKGPGEGCHAHDTHYAYKNIKEFAAIFEKYFSAVEVKYWSNTLGYLYRFPILNIIAKIYDKIINRLNIKMLMGNVCLVFKKNN